MADEMFPVGRPAERDELVDRDEFIEQVATRLFHRNSVILAAPRRTGKTSVAREVLRRLRDRDDAFTAAVDLSAVSSVRQLADKLTAACLANAPGLRTLASARENVGRLLRIPEVRARAYDYEIAFEFEREDHGPSPDEALERALALPATMAAKHERLFVILFDEFQAIRSIGSATVLARMRSVLQLQQRTAFLFLGSQASLLASLFGSRQEPFFRFATWLALPPVPNEAWRTYIRASLARQGITIDDAAIDTILAYTGAHPYDTMQVAFEAYVAAGRRRHIDGGMAMLACAEAQRKSAPLFDLEVELAGPRGRAILTRIAQGEPLYAGERSRASISSVLKELIRTGILLHVGHGKYQFTEPMLARHLERV